jgi:hypothetical protein
VLREMIDEGLPVYDRHTGGARPVGPGDVALLSRTWEPLDVYAEALSATGVPSVHAGGGNLSETREAKDGLALLRFIADPRDDLALIALLRSPFFAVDDRTLHELALERAGVSSWWESVKEASQGSFSYPRGALEEVLSVRRLEPPGALMRLADRLTDYTAVLANLPGADRREADWRGFCELVSGLELGTEDIFSVVRSLRRLGEAGVEIPRPPARSRRCGGPLDYPRRQGTRVAGGSLAGPRPHVPSLLRCSPLRARAGSSHRLFRRRRSEGRALSCDRGPEETGSGVRGATSVLRGAHEGAGPSDPDFDRLGNETVLRAHLALAGARASGHPLCTSGVSSARRSASGAA